MIPRIAGRTHLYGFKKSHFRHIPVLITGCFQCPGHIAIALEDPIFVNDLHPLPGCLSFLQIFQGPFFPSKALVRSHGIICRLQVFQSVDRFQEGKASLYASRDLHPLVRRRGLHFGYLQADSCVVYIDPGCVLHSFILALLPGAETDRRPFILGVSGIIPDPIAVYFHGNRQTPGVPGRSQKLCQNVHPCCQRLWCLHIAGDLQWFPFIPVINGGKGQKVSRPHSGLVPENNTVLFPAYRRSCGHGSIKQTAWPLDPGKGHDPPCSHGLQKRPASLDHRLCFIPLYSAVPILLLIPVCFIKGKYCFIMEDLLSGLRIQLFDPQPGPVQPV